MTTYKGLVRITAAVMAFALCGVPEALAQTAQQPSTTAPQPATAQQPAASPDATQQQQTWPTQDGAPSTTSNPAPAQGSNTPAPSATAPEQTAPQEKQRVVLGSDGQAKPPAAQQNRGTTVDPSAGPLTPTPNAQPAVPSATPEEQTKQATPETPQPQTELQQKPTRQLPAPEPLGTAAAEAVRTSGNGASKPAGAAVAPAKQHRMRSLLIKLGAVAAVGAAVGTVAALSKGTPSVPPNTTSSASK